MKKLSLLFLTTIFAFSVYSQVKIGLRVAPGICINRVHDVDNTDGTVVSSNGSGVRFAVGPTVDFGFADNYAFSTGAWYTSSRAGYTATTNTITGIKTYSEVVSLQSVQIPLTFKVTTNEIATNLKVYFQLGTVATINFYEKLKESEPAANYAKKYAPIDFSVYMGAGVKYKIGESNELFAGLFYNRGLVNLFENKDSYNYKDAARFNMDQVGMEVGVTF